MPLPGNWNPVKATPGGSRPDFWTGEGSYYGDPPAGYEWNPLLQSFGRTPTAAGGRQGQEITGLMQAAPGLFGLFNQFGPQGQFPGSTFPGVKFPTQGGYPGTPGPGGSVAGGVPPATYSSQGGQLGAPFGQQADPSALAGLQKALQGNR